VTAADPPPPPPPPPGRRAAPPQDSPAERNIRFGVREHAMGAICNGIGLHNSGLIPYCATFFIFTDYMRAAMRVSALSEVSKGARGRRARGGGGGYRGGGVRCAVHTVH
jgi:hypothetical protein